MEFITSVIASALGSLGVEAVKSGYTKLKELLSSKFGEKSALAEAVRQLEQNPDSAGRKAVVAEEVEKSGAHEDAELLALAKQLQEQLNGVHSQGNVFIHQGSGEQNIAQGAGAIGKQVHTGSGDNVGRDKIIKG